MLFHVVHEVVEEFDLFLLDEILNRLNLQEDEARRDFIENLVNYETNSLIGTSFYPMGGPKIGGWIGWCGDVDFPQCPDCGVAMDLTFLSIYEDGKICKIDLGSWLMMNVTLCPRCLKPGIQMNKGEMIWEL